MKLFLIAALAFGLASADAASLFKPKDIEQSVDQPKVEVPSQTPTEGARIALYWENTTEAHPERALWSDTLTRAIRANIDGYDVAKDIADFCPKYSVLSLDDRVKAVGELFVAMSYYESGFKPDTYYRECNKLKCRYFKNGLPDCRYDAKYGYCMKGGPAVDDYTIVSRGLGQMSILSSISYGCEITTPTELHEPVKNLVCMDKIMRKQIKNKGKIKADSNYWAVIKPINSSNHISEITARVKKYAPACIK